MQTSDPDLSISPIIFEAPQIRRFYELHASEFTLSTPNKGNMLLKLLSSPLDTPSFRFASRFIRQTNDLFNELLEESRMRTPFSAGKKRKVILTNKDMIKKQEEDKNLKINEETIIKTPMIIEESTIKTTLNNIADQVKQKNFCPENERKIITDLAFIEKKNLVENSKNTTSAERNFRDDNRLRRTSCLMKTGFRKNLLTNDIKDEEKKKNDSREERLRKEEIKKRKRKSNQQLKILKLELDKEGFWSKEKIGLVSKSTGLSESQVYKWFWDQKKKKNENCKIDSIKESSGIDCSFGLRKKRDNLKRDVNLYNISQKEENMQNDTIPKKLQFD